MEVTRRRVHLNTGKGSMSASNADGNSHHSAGTCSVSGTIPSNLPGSKAPVSDGGSRESQQLKQH